MLRRVPAPLVALPLAALLALLLGGPGEGFAVETIATRFETRIGDAVVAGIPRLPPLPLAPWRAEGEAHARSPR